ncbi:hypothetical protein RUND412_002473 [Rhizina undulata]
MDTVPTEIVHEILSYLPERNLGSLRLVNRFFNTAANNRYFHAIRIPFTDATIENLVHLSHTSSLLAGKGRKADNPKQLDAVVEEVFDVVKFALSKMPNIREITMDLGGRKLCRHDCEAGDLHFERKHELYSHDGIRQLQ